MANDGSTQQPTWAPADDPKGLAAPAADGGLVSVVIPAFNEADHLATSIGSVLAQTWRNLEVIVVDDGSTDGTAEFVRQLAEPRVRLVRQPVNRGPSAARNRGLLTARGRWIAFLDADDAWRPEKISRQLQAMQRTNACACTCGYRLSTKLRQRLVTPQFAPAEFRNLILFGCTISPGSTLLVEHGVFARVGLFDETLRRLEDWDWLLRYASLGNMIAVPEPLVDVTYDEGEKFRNEPDERDPVLHAIEQIKAKHLSRLKKGSRIGARKFESTLWLENAAQHYRKGAGMRACVAGFRSLAVYPLRNLTFFQTATRALARLAVGSRRGRS
jgi:glycosyltransferase involved in cell wall biosynthesis